MTEVMTEEQRIEELDRQLKLIELHQAESVFCPWCGVLNTADSDDCCPPFTSARDARGERQLQSIIEQRHLVLRGHSTCISCPYCHKHNYIRSSNPDTPPADWKRPMISPFCCDLFQDAAIAIAERAVKNAERERKARIDEGIARAERN